MLSVSLCILIFHRDASYVVVFFFFNDTAATEIYTLSLHDALPIFHQRLAAVLRLPHLRRFQDSVNTLLLGRVDERSEEHTSELQSRQYLVCRLLLEKKKSNYRKKSCHYRPHDKSPDHSKPLRTHPT